MLEHRATFTNGKLPHHCRGECFNLGYEVFGVQGGGECWCGWMDTFVNDEHIKNFLV